MTGQERLELLRGIVNRHQHAEIALDPEREERVIVDATTANAMLTIHGMLSNKNAEHFLQMPWLRAVDITWKLINSRTKH